MKAQTSVEFLLLLAAMLVTLAGILAYLVTSSSSVGSSVSGEVENTRQEASNILKSQFGTFRTFLRDGTLGCGGTWSTLEKY
jgi:uncharacterized protein (UPF0333 family)